MTSPLWGVEEPATQQAGKVGKRPGRWCEEGPHWLTDPVSIEYGLGPDCRKKRGIKVPSKRRLTRLARVRAGWGDIDGQADLLQDQEQELNEEGERR